MGMITCPYCSMEVNEDEIEVEDGCCPECGAMLTVGSLFFGDDEYVNAEDRLKEPDEYLEYADEPGNDY